MPPSLLALLAAAVLAFTPIGLTNSPTLQPIPANALGEAPQLVVKLDAGRARAATGPLVLRQVASLGREAARFDGVTSVYGPSDLVRELQDDAASLNLASSSAGIPDDAQDVVRLLARAPKETRDAVFDEELRRLYLFVHHEFRGDRDQTSFELALREHARRYLSPDLAASLEVESFLRTSASSTFRAWIAAGLFALLALCPAVLRTARARAAAMYPSAVALVWIAADRGSAASISPTAVSAATVLAVVGLGLTLMSTRSPGRPARAALIFAALGLVGCASSALEGGAGSNQTPILREAQARADGEIPGARVDPRETPGLVVVHVPKGDLYDRATPPDDGLHLPSNIELELAKRVNEYRARHGQRSIPWSRSLSHVARAHAKDLETNPPKASCMIHSWSDSGDWEPCCYSPDHAQASCMWNKPHEISSYSGVGFEIAYLHTAGARPELALKAWRESEHHRAVLLNRGKWSDNIWRAMGAGVVGDYAVVWFGEEWDPAGYWRGAKH